jgi:hypothetical protein
MSCRNIAITLNVRFNWNYRLSFGREKRRYKATATTSPQSGSIQN